MIASNRLITGELQMAMFKLGGAGPDNMGLGFVIGLNKRFDNAGEIYVTDVPTELEVLHRLSERGLAINLSDCKVYREAMIEEMKWRDLVSMGAKIGVFKPGMKKAELIIRIVNSLQI